MSIPLAIGIIVIVLILFTTGYWWRSRSIACPASLSWLIENPYMNAVSDPNKKLLDVGSGPGRLTLPAAKLVEKSGEVVALDLQSKMLDKLKERAKKIELDLDNVRLVHAAAGSGKIDKEYFDRVLLVTVLGEIPNKHEALEEIYESLKEDGILSVTEVIPDPHYTTIKNVRALCHNVGFQEIDSFGNWLAFTINFIKQEKKHD